MSELFFVIIQCDSCPQVSKESKRFLQGEGGKETVFFSMFMSFLYLLSLKVPVQNLLDTSTSDIVFTV